MSTTFAALGVPPELTRALEQRGITSPFPIQAATIPDGLAGRDICGRAPTGSGKTLAFGLPIAARVTHAGPKAPKALVLVPTRELAAQVKDELDHLARPMGRTVHAFYGGSGFGAQVAALRKGVDVAVACPGRLADLVQRGDVRLDRVNIVVVDEADRMADMGFLPEVRRLLDQVAPDRQTLLFSATLDGEVDTLIRRYQTRPVRHGVDVAEDAPVNHHVLWRSERSDRVGLTAEIVSSHWPAVVFSRTKHGADRLSRQLGKLGVSAEAIHGNRSQPQRERALRSFSSGRVQALVATDVAARGIHVDGVACVVHFDAPPDPKDFVHRSGRTGRAGTTGIVVTLAAAADTPKVARMIRSAGVEVTATEPDIEALGQPVDAPPRRVPARPRPDGRTASGTGPNRGSDGRRGGARNQDSRPGGPRQRDGKPGDGRSRRAGHHGQGRTDGPEVSPGRRRQRRHQSATAGPAPSTAGRGKPSRPRAETSGSSGRDDRETRSIPSDRTAGAARSNSKRRSDPTPRGRSENPRSGGQRPTGTGGGGSKGGGSQGGGSQGGGSGRSRSAPPRAGKKSSTAAGRNGPKGGGSRSRGRPTSRSTGSRAAASRGPRRRGHG